MYSDKTNKERRAAGPRVNKQGGTGGGREGRR